jgi:hypothetical protein
MYNRNYGVLTVNVSTLGIAKVCAKQKINAYKHVTDGYTGPLCVIRKHQSQNATNL